MDLKLIIIYIMYVSQKEEEKTYLPFWNNQTKVLSKKLSLPIETDLQDSPLNSSNGCWKKMIVNSWFSMNQFQMKKNLQTISFPSYIYSLVKKWEKKNIKKFKKVKTKHKTLKIKIYPSFKQKKLLKKWSDTYRAVCNNTIEKREKENYKNNFFELRNKLVTANSLNESQKWQLDTPKEIRANAVKEVVSNYKTAYKLLKNKNIKHFKMKFRTRKNNNDYIVLSKSSIKKIDETHFSIYPRKNFGVLRIRKDKTEIKEFLDGIKIKNNYMYIPVKVEQKCYTRTKYNICSLDPGVKTFNTIYSNKEIMKIGDRSKILKMYKLIDKYKSIKSRVTKYLKYKLNKRIQHMYNKIKNKVDEIHWKTCNYLTNTYDNILLPNFQPQKMTKHLNRKTNRELMFWSHFKFKQRLIWKCSLRNNNLKIVDESYTSKTCSNCGWIDVNLSNKNIFKCKECKCHIDRDTNGARNILLKEMAGYVSIDRLT